MGSGNNVNLWTYIIGGVALLVGVFIGWEIWGPPINSITGATSQYSHYDPATRRIIVNPTGQLHAIVTSELIGNDNKGVRIAPSTLMLPTHSCNDGAPKYWDLEPGNTYQVFALYEFNHPCSPTLPSQIYLTVPEMSSCQQYMFQASTNTYQLATVDTYVFNTGHGDQTNITICIMQP